MLSSGTVEGFNNKVKLVTRKSYGFKTQEAYEIALCHNLGELPQLEFTQILLTRPNNLSFSPGGIVRATQSLANKSKGLITVLKLQIDNRDVVHADETGWWLKGINCYATPVNTYLRASFRDC